MIKVGIIGFGKMGILHGALLNGSGKAKVVAICDKSWVMRFGFKRVYKSVKVFKDVDKMLNTIDLDVVIIATPTFNHVESAIKCANKGCSMFIEKPLSSSFIKANELYKIVLANKVKVQVGFCNRFAPTIIRGKELLDNGIIGKPIKANAYMYIADVFEKHTGWRYKKNISGGGVLMDFGIHMLDQIYWYFGNVSSVLADSKKLYSEEVEDELSAELLFQNEVKVHFETSWSKEEYRKSYARLEIEGSKGKMEVTDQTLIIYDLEGKKIESLTYPDIYGGAYMDVGGVLYSNQMQSFLDYLIEEKVPTNSIKSAVYIQKLIETIYESIDKKVTVLMEDI